MSTNEMKFTLCYNLIEYIYKTMYYWNMTKKKYQTKGTSNQYWKYEKHEGIFYHAWCTCEKARKFWIQIYTMI